MIFHPNPMIEIARGQWRDQRLSQVVVKAIAVNNSKNKTRWVVFKQTSRQTLVTLTRHITQEQAVVSAQTLANRLWKQSLRKDKPKSRRINRKDRLSTITAERERMTQFLDAAIANALAGKPTEARRYADDLVQFLEQNF